MKTLAKIVLGVWALVVGGAFLFYLITYTKETLIIVCVALVILFFILGPFWAFEQLSK